MCEEPAVPLDPPPPSLFSFPAIVGLHQQHPAEHQAVGGGGFSRVGFRSLTRATVGESAASEPALGLTGTVRDRNLSGTGPSFER